jgi:hypothetical protein
MWLKPVQNNTPNPDVKVGQLKSGQLKEVYCYRETILPPEGKVDESSTVNDLGWVFDA